MQTFIYLVYLRIGDEASKCLPHEGSLLASSITTTIIGPTSANWWSFLCTPSACGNEWLHFEHLNLEGSPNLFKPLPEMHVLLDGQAYRMILNLMNALQLPTLSTTFTWNALVFSEANWTLISPRLYWSQYSLYQPASLRNN